MLKCIQSKMSVSALTAGAVAMLVCLQVVTVLIVSQDALAPRTELATYQPPSLRFPGWVDAFKRPKAKEDAPPAMQVDR